MPVHRGTLMWLLVCQSLAMAPFFDSHPVWLMALLFACLLWRAWALQRGILTLYPGVKGLAVLVGLLILAGSGYRHYDIDTMVAVVLLGFALKVLETWRHRDTHMLVFTGYFLCAAHFIYSQSPWQTLYTLVTVIGLLACANSVYRVPEFRTTTVFVQPLKTALAMIALSIPLALLLFFIVPRVPPLWTIPQQQRAATGLGDSVTPGDIASLVQSADEAFRVRFFGATPQRDQWYWRALAFQEFDGRTWRQGRQLPVVPISATLKSQSDFRYQLILEPSGQQWLPTLDTPTYFSASLARYHQVRTLEAKQAIHAVSAFTVSSNTKLPARYIPGATERQASVELPRGGNPQLRRWAQTMRNRSQSDGEFVNAVLNHIREQSFFYTLQPPLLTSSDTQDEFWFESQAGFCSHYAGAFVFIMRTVGIPARMIGGYLGGRVNEEQKFITVRQMDAHAWAEVWLPARGWVRVDPTTAVAPERVTSDLSDVFADTPEFVSSLAGRTYDFLPLRRLQIWLDVFEYQWQRAVVQFGEDERSGFIERLFGKTSEWWKFFVVAGALAAIFLVWWVLFNNRWRQRRESENTRLLVRLEKKLATQELIRESGETVVDFLARAAKRLPDHQEQLRRIALIFNKLEYAPLEMRLRTRLHLGLRRQIAELRVS